VTLRVGLVAAAAVVVTAIIGGGWFTLRTVGASQREEVDQQLTTAIPTAFAIAPPNSPRPQAAAVPTQSFSEVYVARITADGSRVTIATPQRAASATPAVPSVASTGLLRVHIETVGSVEGHHRWRAVLLEARGAAGSSVLVAVSLDQAEATIRRLRLAVLAGAVGALAAVALAAWLIVRLGLRPIAEVAAAADAITAGERERRVMVRHPRAEAGHLGRAFNVMLDEHQASEDRLRRFIADASHELRTPVASIRAFADLHRHGGLEEPDALDDAMRRIGGESARMADLVDDLLLLARLDEGRPLERVPTDLAGILHDAALDASVTHPSRDVRVEVDGPLPLVGDEARLHQVASNLVHNALTHAGADARVTIRGRTDGDVCIVEISDNGTGMDPDSHARAFDRFWRGDTSRSRRGAGAGLGLSIVRAIVEAHGGHVTLDSAPGAGTTVRLALPALLAAQPAPVAASRRADT
jgi:two-component system, OmpR family, sensor kinase